MTLYYKLKQFNIQRFLLTHSNPTPNQWQQFGCQLDKRFKLLDNLLLNVKRGTLSEQQLINNLGAFIIIRVANDDLDTYQDQITDLSYQLENGDIDESQFTNQLTAITTSILMIMFLLGSGSGDSEQLSELRQSLESGNFPDINLSSLPLPVNAQLQQAIGIAETSALNLGAELIEGNFEPGGNSLPDRLAMWLNTAIGIYGLGQLFGPDDTKLMWLRGPTSDSCGDCRSLAGQVHTSLEWRNFYSQTGKRPQGEGLACHGFRCLCTLVETDNRTSGSFT